jgi:hypothetical protein
LRVKFYYFTAFQHYQGFPGTTFIDDIFPTEIFPSMISAASSTFSLSTSVPQSTSITQTLIPTTLTTAITTSISIITAIPTTPPTNTTVSAITEIYYPPAASQYALSVPAIIGIVIGGVGFLVLCAITAAFTVCVLDRKKETKAEKEERNHTVEQEAKTATTTENSSVAGSAEHDSDNHTNEPTTNEATASTPAESSSIIGPRYARMIGVNTNANNNTQSSSASASANAKAKGKQKEREKMIVHLPVHVADLGTPRQSQIHYEREDPGDEERDERGFRRGASWWHPEL